MQRFFPPVTLLVGCLLLAACNEESAAPAKPAPNTSPVTSSAVATPSFVPVPVPTPYVVQIGAGFNESIANVNNSLIAQSGVRWVRAYVNLVRNYWVFDPATTNVPPRYPIIGFNTNNLIQDLSDVSSDADVLAIAALDQLINTKTVAPAGQPMNVILSLKHDFSYPYPAGTTNFPFNQFPDLGTPDGAAAVNHMVSAIFNILTINDRVTVSDILKSSNQTAVKGNPRETENFFPEGGHSCPPCRARQECRTSEEWSAHLISFHLRMSEFSPIDSALEWGRKSPLGRGLGRIGRGRGTCR